MNTSQPPELARWFLSHFGCSPNNDAVIGDLDERLRNGRTASWYWKHALTALIMEFINDIVSNKLLAVLALFTGWGLKDAWIAVINDRRSLPELHRAEDQLGTLLLFAILTITICAASAWLVGRVGGTHGRATVLLYLLVEVVSIPAMFLFNYLWIWPFSLVFDVGLRHFAQGSYVAAFWMGTALMIIIIIVGSGQFGTSQEMVHKEERHSTSKG